MKGNTAYYGMILGIYAQKFNYFMSMVGFPLLGVISVLLHRVDLAILAFVISMWLKR